MNPILLSRFLRAGILLLLAVSLRAQTSISLPLNILQSLKNGSATFSSSTLDIGGVEAIFDDNPQTLARSANINPMVLTIGFSQSVSTTSFKVNQGFGNGWFTLEAADDLTDLNAKSGSYLLLEKEKTTTSNGDSGIPVVVFHAVARKVFRLTLQRTTGDNYVHLQDWMIYGKETLFADRISASPSSITLFLKRKLDLKHPSKSAPKIFGHLAADSFAISLDAAIWSISDPAVLSLDTLQKTIEALQTGSCDLIAMIGDFSLLIPVTVVPLTNGAGPDLAVRYIKRLPEIDYVENSPDPTRDGWPGAGQEIIWRAKVRNWSQNTYPEVGYQWQKNGQVMKSGVLQFRPDEEISIDFPDQWSFKRDTLVFIIDPSNLVPEFSEKNNSLLIYTNAISLNFYVEQSLYDYFYLNQHKLGLGTNSWDDWAQILHVKRWNLMFYHAVFPGSPDGVLDRIRVDSIVIVPDGALPLAGGLASNSPNANDRTVDLQWGFPYSAEAEAFYSTWPGSLTEVNDGNPFYFEGSLLHELGHARYLIDTYGMDLTTAQVQIEEEGLPIAGSKYLPVLAWDVVYYNKNQGLMSGGYTALSSYDAACLNQIAFRRAVCGNRNAPCNIGIFINDLPVNNFITLKDQDGHLLAHANIEVYAAKPMDGWYGKQFDDTPALTFTTDSQGRFNIGNNPFAAAAASQKIEHTYGFSNMDLILRAEKDQQAGYRVVEATDFNMEYWMGNTVNGNYVYSITMHDLKSTSTRSQRIQSFAVFPNPVSDILYFALPGDIEKGTLSVYSISAQHLATYPLQSGLDVSQLLPGSYFLLLRTDYKTWRTRFIKQ